VAPRPARGLLRDVLPQVSRSFALSLALLPGTLRAPMGITYLVARAADTIADTRALPPAERRRRLEALRGWLAADGLATPPEALPASGSEQPPGERQLLARLPEVLGAYHALDPGDRRRAHAVLRTLAQAMLDALAHFPAETEGRIGALETHADLDRYTYMNAGCVGEFWTEMVAAHRPSCRRWDVPAMCARGVAFGQGLQLVNVLRDLPRDLRTGRCYLPRTELLPLGLRPEDLLDPSAVRRVRPLVLALCREAAAHLAEGRRYTLAVPRRELRLRVACALPLLIGLATLGRLARADDLLDPALTLKIPRRDVHRHLALATLLAPSNRGLATYLARQQDRTAAGVGPG
jgi:farnesyl-diphosphate farnesyltransferase